MNRAAKLADLSDEELKREATSLEESIFKLRFRLQTGRVENPSGLGRSRRDLARVKTLLRERELGINRQRAAAAKAAGEGEQGSRSEGR